MTIALVCPDGWSILLFCKGIIRALKSVHNARVIVVSDAGDSDGDIRSLGVESVSVPIARWTSVTADLKYCRDLARVFRRERCDVVLNFSTKPNIYGSIAARLSGVPTVMSHVVGLGAAFQPAANVRAQFLQRLVLALYKIAASFNRRIWFTNAGDVRFFLERGIVSKDQPVLTKNYLDVSAYAPGSVSEHEVVELRQELGLRADQPVVAMVARMIWSKGIREFADAARRLRDAHPDAFFVLVAPLETGSLEAVPESFVREVEREANFRWLGFRKDVKRVYALSDVAVLPSYYKEGGYPRGLLEPMAMGKPVITTTSDDCRGTVDDGQNGFLVPARDAASLAEAISTLLSDERKRRAFGKCSREKAVREFDEQVIVREALATLGLPVQ